MFGMLRAGGRAAATIVLTVAVAGAGPSQAWALSGTASTPPVELASVSLPTISPFQGVSYVAPGQIELGQVEPDQIVLPVETAPAATPTGDGTVIETTAPLAPVASLAVQAPADVEPATVPTSIAAPVVIERATLAQLVAAHRSSATPDRERECLAGAIYFEAKGEPLSGQVAVGQVIANRAKSGRFPSSFCGVVFQRSQFSFVRGRALPAIPRASAHWKTAVAVAHIVANGLTQAIAPKSLFFHARYVSPNWKRMSKVATVGNHIFYR